MSCAATRRRESRLWSEPLRHDLLSLDLSNSKKLTTSATARARSLPTSKLPLVRSSLQASGPARNEHDFAHHVSRTVALDPDAEWIFIVDNLYPRVGVLGSVRRKCLPSAPRLGFQRPLWDPSIHVHSYALPDQHTVSASSIRQNELPGSIKPNCGSASWSADFSAAPVSCL